jgi:pimeloyl-ACP methyl ester carboxylesterase
MAAHDGSVFHVPVTLEPGPDASIGGRIFTPDAAAAAELPAPIWVVAMPGGAASWRYFDMRVPGYPDDAYSYAAFMAARGVGTVAIDTLGIGESEFPYDVSELTLEAIAAANHQAGEYVRHALQDGTLVDLLDPVEAPFVAGLGHSGGSGATIVQQSLHATYDGVALFGMPADDFKMYGDGQATAHDVMHPNERGLLVMDERPLASRLAGFYPDTPAEVTEAFLGMLPVPPSMTAFTRNGTLAQHAKAIECPVLIGFGEQDLAGSPLLEASRYPNSIDSTVYIQPKARHNHFASSTRVEVWTMIYNWLWSRAKYRS